MALTNIEKTIKSINNGKDAKDRAVSYEKRRAYGDAYACYAEAYGAFDLAVEYAFVCVVKENNVGLADTYYQAKAERRECLEKAFEMSALLKASQNKKTGNTQPVKADDKKVK